MAYGKVIMRDADSVQHTRSAKTHSDALMTAQFWCIHGNGKHIRSASIVRNTDGKRVMHYWYDNRLQYIRY